MDKMLKEKFDNFIKDFGIEMVFENIDKLNFYEYLQPFEREYFKYVHKSNRSIGSTILDLIRKKFWISESFFVELINLVTEKKDLYFIAKTIYDSYKLEYFNFSITTKNLLKEKVSKFNEDDIFLGGLGTFFLGVSKYLIWYWIGPPDNSKLVIPFETTISRYHFPETDNKILEICKSFGNIENLIFVLLKIQKI